MRGSIATIISIVNSGADDSFVILGICPEQSGKRPVCSPCSIYDGGISMTKLKTLGAICLAVSLAAASPALARGGHVGGGFHGGGFHGGGAHFAGEERPTDAAMPASRTIAGFPLPICRTWKIPRGVLTKAPGAGNLRAVRARADQRALRESARVGLRGLRGTDHPADPRPAPRLCRPTARASSPLTIMCRVKSSIQQLCP